MPQRRQTSELYITSTYLVTAIENLASQGSSIVILLWKLPLVFHQFAFIKMEEHLLDVLKGHESLRLGYVKVHVNDSFLQYSQGLETRLASTIDTIAWM